jgi:hypothetical protein
VSARERRREANVFDPQTLRFVTPPETEIFPRQKRTRFFAPAEVTDFSTALVWPSKNQCFPPAPEVNFFVALKIFPHVTPLFIGTKNFHFRSISETTLRVPIQNFELRHAVFLKTEKTRFPDKNPSTFQNAGMVGDRRMSFRPRFDLANLELRDNPVTNARMNIDVDVDR